MATATAPNDLQARLDAAQATLTALRDEKSRAQAPANPSPEAVFGTQGPHIRTGENPHTSRGFSFLRLAGVTAGVIPAEHAKIELDIARRMHKCLVDEHGFKRANSGTIAKELNLPVNGGYLAPLGFDYLPEQVGKSSLAHEVKSLIYKGVEDADPEEIASIRGKMYSAPGQKATPQSWLDETLGGPLVAPPEMGELVDLLRNKEAMVNAGARVIPLPPQGRIVFPRQTAATSGFWVGENAPITQSNFQTGQLELSAKKVAAICVLPNELIRFANPAAEAILRQDMTKTLALTADLGYLQGQGSSNVPLGLINTAGVTLITATTTGSNGDTMKAADLYAFPLNIEENNAEMEGWIMRPSSFYKLLQLQANQGGGAATGAFVFSMMRDMKDKFQKIIAGMPATTTPQVSNTRVKGSGNNLTYIAGGMWSDAIIGMFGAIEFAAATQGDNEFFADQTAVRAILTTDFGVRHPGAFAYLDNILSFAA